MKRLPEMFCQTPQIWFSKIWYQILRKTYPWATLVITSWRLIFSRNVNRNREKIRFFTAFFKIDFAKVLSSINDMIF
ncbi:hypothetical protein WA1_10725 [Scytonema hofmannii PCC 7110]|uniref:Uncharacterized protein n=1 Tax=Scytonema hofmannii PCC 7110 TaxID=128403 RepID=A0A139XFZ6_9CYAN|nr:hypothetical protein WA1_10725 [Scytonema hofmannii PCC 7110]